MFQSSPVAQEVKDLALSLQWLGSALWLGFNPWPQNFHMQKKKKKVVRMTSKSASSAYMCYGETCNGNTCPERKFYTGSSESYCLKVIPNLPGKIYLKKSF